RTGDQGALDMVVQTLEHMAAGGIHDQLGGGFHRYATDRAWLVPHFEKMLVDNAQLALVYLAASQATGREDFAAVARDTLAGAARARTSPDGGFHPEVAADSAGEEGRFSLWTPDEIAAVLDPAAATIATTAFGVTSEGQVDGRSVLHVAEPLSAIAERQG